MRPQLDHRVMRHPPDGAVASIQRDRNLGRLSEQPVEFLAKFADVPVHGPAPGESRVHPPNPEGAPVLP